MPPRKSNVSATSAADDAQDGGGTPRKERDTVHVEDLSLPRTMVQRLAKGVLPPNTMLNKDAVLALQKSATVFINYLAHQANDVPSSSNRRTIPPAAIFEALKELEFESFIPRVQAELERFTEVQANKRNDYRRKVKETKDGSGVGTGERATDAADGDGGEGEREAKRVRVSEGGDSTIGNSSLGSAHGLESPSAQLRVEVPVRRGEWNPDEDPDDEGVDDDGDEEDDTGGVGIEEQQPEEEDEEDDEDEYPDEGHRAESLELDVADEEDEKERRRRFNYGPGGERAGGASSGSEMDED